MLLLAQKTMGFIMTFSESMFHDCTLTILTPPLSSPLLLLLRQFPLWIPVIHILIHIWEKQNICPPVALSCSPLWFCSPSLQSPSTFKSHAFLNISRNLRMFELLICADFLSAKKEISVFSIFYKLQQQGLRRCSVSPVLATQVWRQSLYPQDPYRPMVGRHSQPGTSES